MTPERMAQLVARWVRFYTRDLPAPAAERRVEEIDADLHDHIAHERTHGASDRRIAISVLSRMVRGVAADASWRGHHATTDHPTPGRAMKTHKPAHRSTIGILLATLVVLSVPLVAMQFTDEVAWGVFDFVFAGALLVGIGLRYQVVARRAGSAAYRLAVGVALAAGLFLIWAYVAVGILGETGDPADRMYGGVLAVGLVGAVIARFRPEGMARALVAMALAQSLVAVIALIAGKHESPISSVGEIVGVNTMFVALFAGSAWLFRHASRATSSEREAGV